MRNLSAKGPINIQKVFDYPQCAVGTVKGVKIEGTGFLIGPDIVLTCAHNCFNKLLN